MEARSCVERADSRAFGFQKAASLKGSCDIMDPRGTDVVVSPVQDLGADLAAPLRADRSKLTTSRKNDSEARQDIVGSEETLDTGNDERPEVDHRGEAVGIRENRDRADRVLYFEIDVGYVELGEEDAE